MSAEYVKTLTEENFEELALRNGVALVDFWAPWCGPCRMVGPVIDEIAEQYAGKINVGKVNVDEVPALAQKYGVMSIPTIILFKDGQAVQKSVGALSQEELEDMVDEVL